MRNERVEAFSQLLYPGEHKYIYIVRATSIGSFIIPPTKVEEMYIPDIFGRSSVNKLIIK